MSVCGTTPLVELLQNESHLLDAAFGRNTYIIDGDGDDRAVVHSTAMMCEFAFDRPRDHSLSNWITIFRDNWEWQDESTSWMGVLGEELKGHPRDQSGRVTIALQEQLVIELERLVVLSKRIFSDAQVTRDASNYLKGYRAAYNDYFCGKIVNSIDLQNRLTRRDRVDRARDAGEDWRWVGIGHRAIMARDGAGGQRYRALIGWNDEPAMPRWRHAQIFAQSHEATNSQDG